ncbi:MAG: TraB/GumN family protein [Acidiferrobacterales bacterium]
MLGNFSIRLENLLKATLLSVALVAAAVHPAAALADSTPASVPSRNQASVKFSKGLLWKIETAGRAPSYLFGTIHSADPRITTLPDVVRSRFDRASSFTMEMLISGTGIATMAEAMFFEGRQTLRAVIGDELYSQAKQALVDHGLPTRDLNKKKPWVVIMLLSIPQAEAGLPLDMLLQLEATVQGKPTYGLESMAEQIAVFDGMPLDDQIALLRDTMQMRVEVRRQFEELLQAYRDRDLHALIELVYGYKSAATAEAYESMLERLLTRRNLVMVKRMAPRLNEGNAFIAVGAAHLPGESGLLNLLERAGYRLSPLY